MDESLVGLLVHEVEWSSLECVRLKVPYCDVGAVFLSLNGAQVPLGSGFDEDAFSVAEHSHAVHRHCEEVFGNYVSFLVNMDCTIPSEAVHSEEYEGIVVGGIQVQNFEVFLLHIDSGSAFEQHLMQKINNIFVIFIKSN